MPIDNDTVKRIAFLAKLRVEPDNLEETKEEFNKILAWVEELREVDTESTEPLISVNNEQLSLRQDIVDSGHNSEEILANAPAKEYGYFVVPKVVE